MNVWRRNFTWRLKVVNGLGTWTDYSDVKAIEAKASSARCNVTCGRGFTTTEDAHVQKEKDERSSQKAARIEFTSA